MARLKLHLCGTFELKLDNTAVTNLYSDKVRALLAYLILEADRPHTRGELATLLWPDVEEKKARQNGRQTLSQLQKAVSNQTADPPFLLVTRQTVQFNKASDYWLDVEAVRQGAFDVYRGALLEYLIVKESNLFDAWLTIQRESLHREVMALLETKAEAEAQPQEAARLAEKQIQLDPWNEAAYRRWMRYLHSAGQTAVIKQVYAQCQRMLKEELGVEPEPATTALFEALSTTEAPSAPPRPLNLRSNTLPPDKTPFIGREAELTAIVETLQQPTCRWLTLVGLGGAGKTRLGVATARRLTAVSTHPQLAYPDGIWFISLVGADSMLPAVASRLNFTFNQNGDPAQQLINYLADKQLLLLLDNCEELLHEGEWLTQLYNAAPHITLLTTSRQPFDAPAEHLFAVEGMPVAQTAAGTLSDAESLFVAAAQRANARFQLTPEDRAQVVHICQQVLGHPLSIELAASWVRMLDVAEISAEISRNLAIFASSSNQFEARHRSLQTVFDTTWRTLSGVEQQTMAGLSVFRDGFSREAAQTVADASLLTLLQLANKSLVQRQGERFSLHEAVRQYASSRAETLPRAKHAAFYLDLLVALKRPLQSRIDSHPIERLTTDLENIRAGWGWATEHKPTALARVREPWSYYLERAGLLEEGVAQYGRLLPQLAAPAHARFRVDILNDMGSWLLALNQEVAARPLLDEALQLAERHQLYGGWALALTNDALYQFLFRKIDVSIARYQQSLAKAESSDDQAILALCRRRYGRSLENIGHYKEAIQMLNSAVLLAESLGRADISTDLYERLTYAHLNDGDLDEASRCAHVYARAAERMGTDQSIGAANYLLGLVFGLSDDPSQAVPYYKTALTIFERLNLRRRVIVTAVHLALCYQDIKAYDLAEKILLDLMQQMDEEAAPFSNPSTRLQLAGLYGEMGRFEESLAVSAEAIGMIDWMTPTSQCCQHLYHLAEVLVQNGRFYDARPFLTYVLTSPLARDVHREKAVLLEGKLPDELRKTAVAPPTLLQLQQHAQKAFGQK